MYLVRRERVFEAGVFYLFVAWLTFTYIAVWFHGDINSPILGGYLLVITAASLLLGIGYGLVFYGAKFLVGGLDQPGRQPGHVADAFNRN